MKNLFKAHPWHGISMGNDAPDIITAFIAVSYTHLNGGIGTGTAWVADVVRKRVVGTTSVGGVIKGIVGIYA